MTGREPHFAEHGGGDAADNAAAEKRVADAIEEAVDVPSSIEEAAMLEAAEIEELEAG